MSHCRRTPRASEGGKGRRDEVNEGRWRCRMEEHEEEDVDANRIAIYPRARRVYKPPQFYLHPSRCAYNSRHGRIKPFIVLPRSPRASWMFFLPAAARYARSLVSLSLSLLSLSSLLIAPPASPSATSLPIASVVLTTRTSGRVSAMPSSHVIDLIRCGWKAASCLASLGSRSMISTREEASY